MVIIGTREFWITVAVAFLDIKELCNREKQNKMGFMGMLHQKNHHALQQAFLST